MSKDEKGLFIDLIAQHEGLAEELAQDELCSSQEPVHSVQSNGRHSPLLTHMMNKRTTPPKEQQSCDKRPWVGLTEKEIEAARIKVFIECGADLIPEVAVYFACVIEAASKEKNT